MHCKQRARAGAETRQRAASIWAYTWSATTISPLPLTECPNMHYGLDVAITGAYADASLLADLAALAEEAGWDGFFVQDCLLNAKPQALVDPWIALSAIALRTSRVRIGA